MIKRNKTNKGGFTLVEVLISMAIFMIFAGILISSYGSIVKSQREANEYRIMYTEAGDVFETLVREFREGMIDYGHYPAGYFDNSDDYWVVRKDGRAKSRIVYDAANEAVEMARGELTADQITGSIEPLFSPLRALNNNVKVKSFKIYVTPILDPYATENVKFDLNQFQPKVTIFAQFEKNIEGKTYTFPMETTISSRIYNQVYKPIFN